MKRLLLLASLLPALAAAETAPRWELGVGLAAFNFPAYRGSSSNRQVALPLPYFTYHGDIVKADRNGMRASLFDSDRLDITLSASGSPPTSSRHASEREGMPDLKTTFEVGPQIEYSLWRDKAAETSLKFRLPVRAAATIERSPQALGWIAAPALDLDWRGTGIAAGWRFSSIVGPIYATQKQHSYFYSVAPAYATANRPAYQARGGYSGTHLIAAASRRFDSVWLGAFVRYDNLSGAAFANSPLVSQRSSLGGGIALSWVALRSSEMVPVEP